MEILLDELLAEFERTGVHQWSSTATATLERATD